MILYVVTYGCGTVNENSIDNLKNAEYAGSFKYEAESVYKRLLRNGYHTPHIYELNIDGVKDIAGNFTNDAYLAEVARKLKDNLSSFPYTSISRVLSRDNSLTISLWGLEGIEKDNRRYNGKSEDTSLSCLYAPSKGTYLKATKLFIEKFAKDNNIQFNFKVNLDGTTIYNHKATK